MTPAGSRRVILGALAVVVTSTVVRDVRGGRAPAPRVIVGATVVAATLSAISGPAPTFAASMALLIAIGALLSQADVLPSAITTRTTAATGRVTSRTN